MKNPSYEAAARAATAVVTTIGVLGGVFTCFGSENAPRRPFAMWADVPAKGQLVAGIVYEESEAYHIWAGHDRYSVTTKDDGEEYGIDVNQGYVALQYGLTDRWALDLNAGGTTAAHRYFEDGDTESTTGIMDITFGVRYQAMKEEEGTWKPTLTLRAGAVMPGSYEKDFPFAPGVRSAAIEPSVLFRKHLGWTGFGVYGDALYRWNRTSGNDQYITSIGFFQQIKGWELDVGYRHLQTLFGDAIQYDPADPSAIDYPRAVREINDAIEAGFSYTTAKRHIRWGFHTRIILDGSNTDQKFWVGGSVDVPFSLL